MELGALIGGTSRFYEIPKTSLSNQVDGRWRGKKKGAKVVQNQEEEEALEIYMRDIADYGHQLTTKQIKLKVTILTRKRYTPFTNRVLSNS